MAGTESAIPKKQTGGDSELLASLSGRRAARDAAIANRTRRAVLGSIGVLEEQKAGHKRKRAVAIAGLLLAGLGMAPFAWRLADDLFGGAHICDLSTQLSLLICVFCPALVAAVLVAGWMRRS